MRKKAIDMNTVKPFKRALFYSITELAELLDMNRVVLKTKAEAGQIPSIVHPVTNRRYFSKATIHKTYADFFQSVTPAEA
jgi:hypothetical protein